MKKKSQLILILITIVFSRTTSLANSPVLIPEEIETKLLELSKEKKWQKLLYFEKKKSLVDNPEFFLGTKKKTSPLIEAREAYKQMVLAGKEEKIKDEHPLCKFPARYLLLLEKVNRLDLFSKISKCTKLSAFMKRMTGESVSLIFSSYYLNNPSSAFGHTFLKINRSEKADLDLLNYGINYAATVNDEGAVFYALKGLLGFFKGEFTAIPYYYKVREYNDFESRDLWEYKLNLTPKEIALLHLHIWELGRGWSQYYFLSGNCSYWAIKVLEAIKPEYNFSKHFGSTFVIPSETVKSLYKYDGFVKEIKYRPSLREQLISKLNKFSKNEINHIKDLVEKIDTRKAREEELKKETPETLDTSILLYDYLSAPEYAEKEDELLDKKKALLNARSTLPLSKLEEKEIDLKNAPHNSHPPRRIDLGTYRQKGDSTSSLRVGYKQGFHELLDSRIGFNPHMALNFLDISFLIFENDQNKTKVELEHLYGINIDAFTPVTRLDQQFSWRLNFGIDSERYLRNQDQKVGFVNFDTGLSAEFFKNKSLLLYFLMSNTVEGSARFKNKIRVSLAPLVGFKFSLGGNTNMIGEIRPAWFYDLDDNIDFTTQYDFKFQTYLRSLKTALYFSGTYIKPEKAREHYITSGGLRYFF